MSDTRHDFLVSHDYGMGALWFWMSASSPAEIFARFRDVTVHDDPPDWWTEDMDSKTARIDVGDPAPPGLAELEIPAR